MEISNRKKASSAGVKEKLKEQAQKLQGRWRKVITGNPSKRIRDHLREAQGKPKYIKLIDKIGFTLGVLNIVACQYFLLNIPEYFPIWYLIVVPLMMASRFYQYKSLNHHYFMIDFCYFTLFLTMINLLFFSVSSERFFKVCFIFATGVLPIAILVWRNSFIFHEFDKIVSVYIHILPCMLYYTLRWSPHTLETENTLPLRTPWIMHGSLTATLMPFTPLTASDYFLALCFYALWQGIYLLKTEMIDKDKFDLIDFPPMDGERYEESVSTIYFEIPSKKMKTKLVFVFCQLILTIISFIPTPFCYSSSLFHLLWIGFIFSVAVFNGGSFYIEVFSVRYQMHLKKLDERQREMQSIAHDATKLVEEIMTNNSSNSSKGQPQPLQHETAAVTTGDKAADTGAAGAAAVVMVDDNSQHSEQQQPRDSGTSSMDGFGSGVEEQQQQQQLLQQMMNGSLGNMLMMELEEEEEDGEEEEQEEEEDSDEVGNEGEDILMMIDT